jgi:WD repeat-containing protein 40A
MWNPRTTSSDERIVIRRNRALHTAVELSLTPTIVQSASVPQENNNLGYVRKHPIEGKLPSAFHIKSFKDDAGYSKNQNTNSKRRTNADILTPSLLNDSRNFIRNTQSNQNLINLDREDQIGKDEDFLCYNDSDDEDTITDSNYRNKGERVSCNSTDILFARESGLPNISTGKLWSHKLNTGYGTRHMLGNSLFKAFDATIPNLNKIYSSSWISDQKVIFGTKCGKLMVYNVNKQHYSQIESLQSTSNIFEPVKECGLHSIQINPSRSLIATAAGSANDVAIYNLPSLKPICVGEGAHGDWIFDMTWLDDQFLVSGSRDGSLALWRITDDIVDQVTSSDVPSFVYSRPLIKKPCKTADRVRAMCFNSRRSELAVISTNGYIHCWDGLRFKQVMSKRLPHEKENVCITVDDDIPLYAVGSKTTTDLLDTRTLQKIKSIKSLTHNSEEYGTRSVSIKGNILTIGTGVGLMYFWDIRAGKYLQSFINNKVISLKASKGWWQRDDNFVQNIEMIQQKYLPAIYTHCYDTSGTRLFAAGGPLQCGLRGNYVALFQ